SESDPNTAKLLSTLSAHTGAVMCARFNKGTGKRIASGSDDMIILIWEQDDDASGGAFGGGGFGDDANQEHWRPIKRLTGHESDVTEVAWSPDNVYLASCGLDNYIFIWDGETFDRLKRIEGHTQFVKGLAFDPAGIYLASQSDDRTVKVWDAADGEWRLKHKVSESFMESQYSTYFRRPSWSPDGGSLATANAVNGKVPVSAVINREDWKPSISFVGHRAAIEVVKFNPKVFNTLANEEASPSGGDMANSEERRTSEHDRENQGAGGASNGTVKQQQQQRQESQLVTCICAAGSQDRSVSVWMASQPMPVVVADQLFTGNIMDLAWTNQHINAQPVAFLAACSYDGTVAIIRFDASEIGTPISDEEQEAMLVKLGYRPKKTTNTGAKRKSSGGEDDEDDDDTSRSKRILVESATQLDLEERALIANAALKSQKLAQLMGESTMYQGIHNSSNNSSGGTPAISGPQIQPPQPLVQAPTQAEAASGIATMDTQRPAVVRTKDGKKRVAPLFVRPLGGKTAYAPDMAPSLGFSGQAANVTNTPTRPAYTSLRELANGGRQHEAHHLFSTPIAGATPIPSRASAGVGALQGQQYMSRADSGAPAGTPLRPNVLSGFDADLASLQAPINSMLAGNAGDAPPHLPFFADSGYLWMPLEASIQPTQTTQQSPSTSQQDKSSGTAVAEVVSLNPRTLVHSPLIGLSTVQLTVPKIQPSFARYNRSLDSPYTLYCTNPTQSAMEPAKITYKAGGVNRWSIYLPCAVTFIGTSDDVIAAVCEDATLHLFSAKGGGRRLGPPMALEAHASYVCCYQQFCLVLTCAGNLSVWDTANMKTVLRNVSIAPLLYTAVLDISAGSDVRTSRIDSPATVVSVMVRPGGIPVLLLSDGRGYAFSKDMDAWYKVGDVRDHIGSDFSTVPSLSSGVYRQHAPAMARQAQTHPQTGPLQQLLMACDYQVSLMARSQLRYEDKQLEEAARDDVLSTDDAKSAAAPKKGTATVTGASAVNGKGGGGVLSVTASGPAAGIPPLAKKKRQQPSNKSLTAGGGKESTMSEQQQRQGSSREDSVAGRLIWQRTKELVDSAAIQQAIAKLGAKSKQAITLGHLEHLWLSAAQINAVSEMQYWLAIYARRIADSGDIERARGLCKYLLGPVLLKGQIPRDKEGWDSTLAGVPKRQILHQLLPLLSMNRKLQIVTTEYQDALAEALLEPEKEVEEDNDTSDDSKGEDESSQDDDENEEDEDEDEEDDDANDEDDEDGSEGAMGQGQDDETGDANEAIKGEHNARDAS
ncbi:HIR complex subunit, partial [Spiromyces aspiralis]